MSKIVNRTDCYKLWRKQRQKRDDISKYVKTNIMPPFAASPGLYELAWKFNHYPHLIGRDVLRIHEYYAA